MTANQQPASSLPGSLATDPTSTRLVSRALRLVCVSVVFGTLSGAVSVITGLHGRSLSVLAVGLGVLADVTGSAVLIWRFRGERRQPGRSLNLEARAALIVAGALAVVAAVLIGESAAALAARSKPGTSAVAVLAAGISLAVLAPLAIAKMRLGRQIKSPPCGATGCSAASGQPRACSHSPRSA